VLHRRKIPAIPTNYIDDLADNADNWGGEMITYPNRDWANAAAEQFVAWNGTPEQTGDMSNDLGNTIRLLGGGSKGQEACVMTFCASYRKSAKDKGFDDWLGGHINCGELGNLLESSHRDLEAEGQPQCGDGVGLFVGLRKIANIFHWGMFICILPGGMYKCIFGNDSHKIEYRIVDPKNAIMFDMTDYGFGLVAK